VTKDQDNVAAAFGCLTLFALFLSLIMTGAVVFGLVELGLWIARN
jgi:hypothetical protein